MILTVVLMLAAGLATVASGISAAAPGSQPGQAVLVGEGTSNVGEPVSHAPTEPGPGGLRAPAAAAASPQPYPFFPQGGIPWQDLYTFNFVDLDPTAGFQDFDCTQYTYDGHQGHDSAIRTFREQAIGVPVFAALDGTVTDVHDGEFDMVTNPTGSEPSNYVRIDHGGTQETWYFHLKKGSVSVAVGQHVVAGTQIGLTGSSGDSTGPHLHFESRFNGTYFEPSAGPCRPGASNWVNQVPVRRELYVKDFAFSPNTFAGLPAPPQDTAVRTGSYPQGNQHVYLRVEVANEPAHLPWRIRVLAPGGGVANDFSGTFSNSAFAQNAYGFFDVPVNFTQTGTWRVLVDLNSQTYVDAPLTVVASAASIVNRPPNAVSLAFDPVAPAATDVIFCRVNTSLILEDPDYDIISYRYQWTVNGASVRDVTSAALSDAIPKGTAGPGSDVRCTVTPSDGQASGPSAMATVHVAGGGGGAAAAVADFNGDGHTDISLFRPSQGGWYVQGQPTVFFGLNGDIPVPGDYDGDKKTDIAVFRPSVGGWYRSGASPVFFGLNGDIPVPGDYDGDGKTDIAVFRPSVGGWYINGQAPVFFGLNGDIPVPGDYDGDGKTDIAVFRPSVGGWYRNGATPVFLGLSGDIPVPGDYDGNKTTDVAIFRPSVGGWYVNGQSPQFLGVSGDMPVPGDYDGNGTTDIAVFRPGTGAWYVGSQAPVFFGTSGDLPLPLPAAIRMAAFP